MEKLLKTLALSALLTCLYVIIKRWRFNKLAYIPHAYPNTLLFGHIKLVGDEYKKLGDNKRHSGMYLHTYTAQHF